MLYVCNIELLWSCRLAYFQGTCVRINLASYRTSEPRQQSSKTPRNFLQNRSEKLAVSLKRDQEQRCYESPIVSSKCAFDDHVLMLKTGCCIWLLNMKEYPLLTDGTKEVETTSIS